MKTTYDSIIGDHIRTEREARRAIVDTLGLLEPFEGRTEGRVPWDSLKDRAKAIEDRFNQKVSDSRWGFPVRDYMYFRRSLTGKARTICLKGLREEQARIEARIESLDTLQTLPTIEDAVAEWSRENAAVMEAAARRDAARDKARDCLKESGIDPDAIAAAWSDLFRIR